jgi:hypothetical protein
LAGAPIRKEEIMKLQDLETLLLIHGLHRCKLSWAVDHWIATVRDSSDMEFTGRADHIENAVRLAVWPIVHPE